MLNIKKREKKGSTFLTFFFIALVLIILILIYVQREYGMGSIAQKREDLSIQQHQLGFMTEIIKEYLQHATGIAGLKAAYATALYGGSARYEPYWVLYNEPSPQGVPDTTEEIGYAINHYSNKYILSLNNESALPVEYNLGNITHAKVWAEQKDVEEKKLLDEGFAISVRGGYNQISSTLTEDERGFPNGYTSYIYPTRYWYLYRNIKKWLLDEQKIYENSCSYLPTGSILLQPTCETNIAINPDYIRFVVREEVIKFNAIFDDQVYCSADIQCLNVSYSCDYKTFFCPVTSTQNIIQINEISCLDSCYTDLEPVCEPKKGEPIDLDKVYTNNSITKILRPYEDNYYNNNANAPKKAVVPTDIPTPPEGMKTVQAIILEPKVSFIVKIECMDKKYDLPIYPEKRVPMIYTAKLHYSIKKTCRPSIELCQEYIPPPVENPKPEPQAPLQTPVIQNPLPAELIPLPPTTH